VLCRVRIALLVFIGWTTIVACASQVLSGAPYAVSITVTAEKTASPGDFVTHVYTISNIGTLDDEYELGVTTPTGWVTLGVPSSVQVAARESEKLFVTLVVPGTAQAGTYEATLSATSVGDTSVTSQATAHVTVSPASGIVAAWAQEPPRVQPGMGAQGTFTVTNIGNIADTYTIELSSSSDCTVALSKSQIFLFPGETLEIALTLTVPFTLTPGSRYSFTLGLTSTEHLDVSTALVHSSRVAPPPPEEVGGSIFPSWPATVSLAFDETGLTGASLSGTADLEGIGTFSASMSATPAELATPTGSFSTDAWRISLGGGGVSGGFGSVSGGGTGITLFGKVGNMLSSELVIAENTAGLSVSLRWNGGSLRLVGGSNAIDAYGFQEVQFSQAFDELFSFTGSVASVSDQVSSGEAFTISPQVTVGGYRLGGSFLDVSAGFPNRRKEEAYNMTLAYANPKGSSIRLADWSLALDSSEEHTQTAGTTILTTRTLLGVATIALPFDASVRMEGRFERKESDDVPPSTDRRALELDIRISGPLSNGGKYSFSTTLKEPIDRVASTRYLGTQVNGSVSFGLALIDIASSVSFGRIVDLNTGLLQPGSVTSTFSATLSIPSIDSSPKLSLSVSNGSASLGIGLSWGDVSVSVSIPLSDGGSFSASVSTQLSISLPFFGPVYGRVIGRAFEDANENGSFDSGDEAIPDLLLILAGQEAITGDDGRFAFWPVLPGEYTLSLLELPFGLTPLRRFPLPLDVGLGQQLVLLPFAGYSSISGIVYNDANKNGRRDSGETGIPNAIVLVTGTSGRKQAITGSTGRFNIRVEPGMVEVALQVASLPKRFEPTTPATLGFDIDVRESEGVEFGAYQKPREIIFTFGPPTARFETTPREPVVGTEVAFDASSSEAVGVDLVSYDWTFRHASVLLTASGRQVTKLFSELGRWVVTLVVTDANGLQDDYQSEVVVHPSR
jgi:hypothetical protein